MYFIMKSVCIHKHVLLQLCSSYEVLWRRHCYIWRRTIHEKERCKYRKITRDDSPQWRSDGYGMETFLLEGVTIVKILIIC